MKIRQLVVNLDRAVVERVVLESETLEATLDVTRLSDAEQEWACEIARELSDENSGTVTISAGPGAEPRLGPLGKALSALVEL